MMVFLALEDKEGECGEKAILLLLQFQFASTMRLWCEKREGEKLGARLPFWISRPCAKRGPKAPKDGLNRALEK